MRENCRPPCLRGRVREISVADAPFKMTTYAPDRDLWRVALDYFLIKAVGYLAKESEAEIPLAAQKSGASLSGGKIGSTSVLQVSR